MSIFQYKLILEVPYENDGQCNDKAGNHYFLKNKLKVTAFIV